MSIDEKGLRDLVLPCESVVSDLLAVLDDLKVKKLAGSG